MRPPILLLLALIALASAQALHDAKRLCVAYSAGRCISCPFNYHQHQNECYRNITGCLEYTTNITGLRECTSCDPAVSVPDGQGGCRLTVDLEGTACPTQSSKERFTTRD